MNARTWKRAESEAAEIIGGRRVWQKFSAGDAESEAFVADAKKRYYLKHRDALVVRMRERHHARMEKLRAEAEGDPDVAKQQADVRKQKYLSAKQNVALKRLRETLEKPILRPTAKLFIEQELIRPEVYKKMSLASIQSLCSALEDHKETSQPPAEDGRASPQFRPSDLTEPPEESEEEEDREATDTEV